LYGYKVSLKEAKKEYFKVSVVGILAYKRRSRIKVIKRKKKKSRTRRSRKLRKEGS